MPRSAGTWYPGNKNNEAMNEQTASFFWDELFVIVINKKYLFLRRIHFLV